MANVKISALPAVVAATVADFFAAVQAGTTSKITLQQVLDLITANITITESQVTNLVADLNAKVNVAGDTMTGPLILDADPVVALGAATKQYVDAVVPAVSTNTFTPTITASTTPPTTITYASQVGKYTRIDNLINFHVTITLSAFTLGLGAGNLQISSLPFTAANVSGLVPNMVISFANLNLSPSNHTASAQIVPNTTNLVLYETDDNNPRSIIQIGALSATTEIYVSGFYFV